MTEERSFSWKDESPKFVKLLKDGEIVDAIGQMGDGYFSCFSNAAKFKTMDQAKEYALLLWSEYKQK